MHAIIKRHKETTEDQKRQNDLLKKAMLELEKREDAAYENFESGTIDLPLYRRQCEKIKSEREKISATLSTIEKISDGVTFEGVKKTLELCKNLKSLWKTLEDENRVKLLKSLYSNPKLKDGTLEYNLRKPFLMISKIKSEETKYRWPDSNWHKLALGGF